ncbi:putative acetyltransferase [Xylariaceae sp. FL0594]|nr:putative acetyltransferase [Xylariaceae sp. FL0594]
MPSNTTNTTTKTFTIRPRTTEDLPSLAEVLRSVYANSGYPVQGPANASRNLGAITSATDNNNNNKAWVAVNNDNGVVVGHVALLSSGGGGQNVSTNLAVALWRAKAKAKAKRAQDEEKEAQKEKEEDTEKEEKEKLAVLGWLFIHPDHRGRGLASRLIDAVLKEAHERGERVLLFALVKDQDAIRLYRRLGWVFYGNVTYRWVDGDGRRREMEGECFASPV